MRRSKALYAIGLAGALAGIGAWALLKGQGGVQYRTAAVERGEIDSTISATGSARRCGQSCMITEGVRLGPV